jgi:hypothetical protein
MSITTGTCGARRHAKMSRKASFMRQARAVWLRPMRSQCNSTFAGLQSDASLSQ